MEKKVRKHRSWKDEFYVTVYELVKQGMSKRAVAEAIGVSPNTLTTWIKTRPALAEAVKRARANHKGLNKPENFLEYVYRQLPPDVQEVWDDISEFDKEENSIRKAELLVRHPDKIKQHLFVHAMVVSRFSASEACRKVGVTKRTYDRWTTTDSGFARLIEEITWHKKNFFESALIGLVQQGDTTATIFANRTVNSDRGYDTKSKVEITGDIRHSVEDVEGLNISIEMKRQLLDALREKNSPKQITMIDMKDVPDED